MYDHATMLRYTYQLTLTLHLMSPLFTLRNKSNSTTTSEDAERNTTRDAYTTVSAARLRDIVESEWNGTTGNRGTCVYSDAPNSWSGGGWHPAAVC